MERNPHDGHRDRIRKRFLANGLDGFESHEVLELLLFHAIPRKDTNEIAHKLLDDFGSVSAVFDAPISTLEKSGLSRNAALFVKMIPEFCRIYLEDKYDNSEKIIDEDSIGEKMLKKFIGRNYESVVLLLLDAKYKEVFFGVINKGSVNACEVYMRKIMELAITYNAGYAVLSHNHPSGVALPSDKDLYTNKKISTALSLINVELVDHIIVADNDYVSLAQSDLKEQFF